MMGTGRKERGSSKTQTQISLSPAIFTNLLLAGYRMKMPVTEVMLFSDGNSYYVCPRCHMTYGTGVYELL